MYKKVDELNILNLLFILFIIMDLIKNMYMILENLYLFPHVINFLVIEYVTIPHDIKKKISYKQGNITYCIYAIIHNKKLWTYNYNTEELICEDMNTVSEILSSKYSFGHMHIRTLPQDEIEIFVAEYRRIQVFNKNCERTYSIEIFGYTTPKFNILDDKIYVYNIGLTEALKDGACQNQIDVYSTSGSLQKRINVNFMPQLIEIVDKKIYVLTSESKIIHCTSEFEPIQTIKYRYIYSFCVIDDYIYLVCPDGVYICSNFCDIVKLKNINEAEYIFSDNNEIYIAQKNSYNIDIIVYDLIRYNNVAQILKK